MTKFLKIKSVLILSLIFFLPQITLAASLNFSFDQTEIHQGDVVVGLLQLSSSDKPINVMDGVLYYDKNILQVEGLSTGDSIFQFWPTGPAFSNDSGKIFFTGGLAGKFQNNNGTVLKIIFLAKQTGTAKLSISPDSKIYLADGQGTKISAQTQDTSLIIKSMPYAETSKDEWAPQLASDALAPQNLTVVLGQDPTIFKGKYFISFNATDSGSGIYYYQVKEGNGEFTTTESPYLLKDQSLSQPITVKVFDKSGNNTQIIWTAPKTATRHLSNLIVLLITLILLITGIIVFKKWRKIKSQL